MRLSRLIQCSRLVSTSYCTGRLIVYSRRAVETRVVTDTLVTASPERLCWFVVLVFVRTEACRRNGSHGDTSSFPLQFNLRTVNSSRDRLSQVTSKLCRGYKCLEEFKKPRWGQAHEWLNLASRELASGAMSVTLRRGSIGTHWSGEKSPMGAECKVRM